MTECAERRYDYSVYCHCGRPADCVWDAVADGQPTPLCAMHFMERARALPDSLHEMMEGR